MRKTTLMREIEARHGRPVEELIRERIEQGQTWDEIATGLSVTRTTLFIWMCRLGGEIEMKRTVRFGAEESVR